MYKVKSSTQEPEANLPAWTWEKITHKLGVKLADTYIKILKAVLAAKGNKNQVLMVFN